MSETRVDFVIIGSTPLARLVAGLLASAHGKSVVFSGESQSGYRLPRAIDLSVAPITRPESWALLKAGLPEALKLLSRIGGRGAWSRVDPIFFSETPAGKEALAHIRHMALAFGHAAELVPASAIGPGRSGLLLRDAVLLHRPTLEAGLDRWLDLQGVRRCREDETLTVRSDGSAELASGEDRIEIGQAVLADDAAVIDHVPASLWPALLTRRVTSTIFTEPTRPIAASVMHRLDTGLTLVQQAGRGIAAIGPGAIDPFAAALGTLLGREREFRQAGQSSYEALATSDAAPAVGRLRGSGPDILAGLGPSGAFLAPAIARWLCGMADPAESAWLGARLVDRKAAASPVAEYGWAA
ncbi:hypothetical protein ASD04_17935 [Devosia sp. Root436]|uniref:hypothetical protein n=1 Tax=Devosia sp. Root436 TaxID=1736537 RepID=UPI0006F97F85|nr:hypothetical protein [Devosia sp. Root436]KQX41945.1 hypothetical protein ASD04_17935 [Devosia sp. Root436]